MKKLVVLLVALMVLAACAPATPEVIEKEVVVEKPVIETVIVEKEVVVEKPVVETVVVEKEVPVTVEVMKEVVVKEKVVETVVVEKVIEAATPKPPEVVEQVPREETLIFAWEGDPIAAPFNQNPYGGMARDGGLAMMLESLFYLNYETGELVPWLARDHEFNADFTALTVYLREGVEWSDGVPFTAKDVVFTIKMLQEHPTFLHAAAMQQWVQDIKALDDLTVEFKLTAPHPRFAYEFISGRILWPLIIVPEHIWSAVADVETFKNFDLEKGWPVYTGPYRMLYASQNQCIYDRRDDWWGAKTDFHEPPAPRRVIFINQGAAEVGAAKLQVNEIDVSERIAADLFLSVNEKNPKIQAWFDEPPYGWIDPCPRSYFINNQRPPWDDADMRWALSYALDRKTISSAALGIEEGSMPAQFTFPDYPPLRALLDKNQDLFEKYPVTEYNPEKSIKIFEEKGYERGSDGIFQKDGQRLQLEFSGPAPWTPGPLTFPLVIQYWRNVGVDATAKLVSWSVWSQTRNAGEFDVTIVSPCASVVDPGKELDSFHSRYITPLGEPLSENESRWKNTEFDKLADTVNSLPPGDPQIDQLFREALEMWLKELPALPVHQQIRVIPQNTTYWTNWPTSRNNYVHPPSWWAVTLLQVLELKSAQ